MRTIPSGAAQRWVPIGLSGVAVSFSSRFSVSGSREIWASPPAASADSTPAAVSLAR
jgi:hypothetical protein